jgi:hypothetical protein
VCAWGKERRKREMGGRGAESREAKRAEELGKEGE